MPDDYEAFQKVREFAAVHCKDVAAVVALCKEMVAWLQSQIEADPTLRTAVTYGPSQRIKRKLWTEASSFGLTDATARIGELQTHIPWDTCGKVLCDLQWFIQKYEEKPTESHPPAKNAGSSDANPADVATHSNIGIMSSQIVAPGEITRINEEPPEHKVNDAMLAVPEYFSRYSSLGIDTIHSYGMILDLRDQKAILEAATEWAVFRLIEAGHLEAFRIISDDGPMPCMLVYPGNLNLEARPSLWEWWRNTAKGKPPTKKTKTGDETPPSVLTLEERNKRIGQMKPPVKKAYLAYEYAESKKGKRLEDREAYELLSEEGIPDNAGNRGELTDYELPVFDTWARQLRTARKSLGEQKYTRRQGRSHGSSIARQDEIEQPEDDE